jgi:hypothetical protein
MAEELSAYNDIPKFEIGCNCAHKEVSTWMPTNGSRKFA